MYERADDDSLEVGYDDTARLELALEGGLSEKQKLEAEQILANVDLAISDGAYPVRYHPEYLYKLPEGDVEELQQILRNQSTAPWNRGRAGIALGKLYEQQRNHRPTAPRSI